ncbi:MAG TPA: hypothetical protein VF449_12450 [Parvibaculum sp.]
MKVDMDTILAMRSAGIEFIASVRVPGGCDTIALNPEQIESFANDPEQFAAGEFGASKTEYLDWVATDGMPRCGGRTVKGSRCQNPISGGCQRSLRDWLRLDGGYCAVHGGEGSAEAHAKRVKFGE